MITDEKPEYVNDAFLKNFKMLFLNLEENIREIHLASSHE